jgi:hypothetical protein
MRAMTKRTAGRRLLYPHSRCSLQNGRHPDWNGNFPLDAGLAVAVSLRNHHGLIAKNNRFGLGILLQAPGNGNFRYVQDIQGVIADACLGAVSSRLANA